ncbi:MAG: hypothetical protein M1151_04540 [Candidatus Thermoplasmatota archaeon]|jgi:hypothetical protein|nr:hypothetical protein [Candidatus Thermoplasmatota archaeon]
MYRYDSTRTSGINIFLILVFIATGFLYLLVGLVLFLVSITGLVFIGRDAIFVLWLFGFVAMMIFGLSYMFASGLAKDSAIMKLTISKEYFMLNLGIVLFFSGFSGLITKQYGEPMALIGVVSIMVSVVLHLLNLILVVKHVAVVNAPQKSFADDY